MSFNESSALIADLVVVLMAIQRAEEELRALRAKADRIRARLAAMEPEGEP